MNWIAGLQRAIDYAEARLTEEIDYTEAAKYACASPFYFQRVFGLVCGCTFSEYVRARRMTLAGMELASSRARVLDVALKYGYDTPESFARAFTKFHGVSPSQAKLGGAPLRSCSPIRFKLTMEGGSMIDYRIEEKPEFKVLEKTAIFSNKDGANLTDIPRFWEKTARDGSQEVFCESGADESMLGICLAGEGDRFTYAIAIRCVDDAKVPEGFDIRVIPARTWRFSLALGRCRKRYRSCGSGYTRSSSPRPTMRQTANTMSRFIRAGIWLRLPTGAKSGWLWKNAESGDRRE